MSIHVDSFRRIVLVVVGASALLVAAPCLAQEDETTAVGEEEGPGAPVQPETPQLDPEEIERADREDQLTYDPRGRRDPFRPLTGDGGVTEGEREKFRGTLRGLLWTEVKLTAIMKTPEGSIATFEGGIKKTGYFAREGDRFWNAIVDDIDFDNGAVTIKEELDDPRLLKPYRLHVLTLVTADQARAGLSITGTQSPGEGGAATTNPLGSAKVVNSKRVPGGY